ncbi:TIGR02680 family protein [Solwaraspora sp. WMMD406]|uniref:TIGR02680 family protein n=1 Tax=Solwaraspora sp. WMMD406 TaxID=3016095 RepID=UPI0024169EBF|nr:TIGR02680 family protein [Solwaraspora sp. WMMD406]MDG4768378.1 TIGR02680 family protein [Solwaraspora sp. WMMD406]
MTAAAITATASARTPDRDLPVPDRERWQPLRSGLVDIFYYDQEEFHFHGGSLLLRGNNGTGKSKVLALTVPFLLDGELAPYRVEPDGDPHKRMEWNLLLGGRHPHPERTGYTWLEFGRRDADGTARYLTIGCGLKAVAGRGIARHWYFTTSQRIGADLQLLTPTGTASTRDRLRDAIGPAGMIYDRAVDYRRAVDEALFGLGDRYDALVSLLIKLRQPQLSKRPDEKTLSRALGDALPPLDENLIAQVAEAFRGLDDERETLTELRETKKAADDFLTRYRQYARIATKRKAAMLRQQHSRYEQLGRELGEAQRAHEQADQAVREAEVQLAALDARGTELEARRRALAESPQARTAEHLRRLREAADQLAAFADRQAKRLRDVEAEAAQTRRTAEQTAEELQTAQEEEAAARTRVADGAVVARIADRHRDRVLTALPDELRGDRPQPRLADGPAGGLDEARRAADQLVADRRAALRTLDRLRTAAELARIRADRAREEVDRLDAEMAAADEAVTDAETVAAEQGETLVRRTGEYLTGLVELSIADPEAVLGRLDSWVSTLDGDNPAAREVTAASRAAAEAIARADAAVEAEQRRVADRVGEIDAELRRLTDGAHQPPPAPHTRSPQVRLDRPGAPLWRVVDFVEDVPPQVRAGIEAALEAAGVLDAWIDPDGMVRDPDSGDALLRPTVEVATNLGTLLRPAIDDADPYAAALTGRTVAAVLAAIGLGADSGAPTWVGTDGGFGIGVVTGRWTKPDAEHIGDGAREAARRARIAALRAEADELATVSADLAERRATLADRRQTAGQETESLPSDQPLREAHTLVRGAHQLRRDTAGRRGEAAARHRTAVSAARTALAEATEFADDVGLPHDADGLAEVRDGLQNYQVTLAAWWPTLTGVRDATRRRAEAFRTYEEKQEQLEPAAIEAAEAAETARLARVEFETLDATAGATVAELERQLREVADAEHACQRESRETRQRERDAWGARGDADGRRDRLTGELAEATATRDAAVEVLRAFADTGLIALACPEQELPDTRQLWATTPAVAVARGVDRLLADVDDGDRPWERIQHQVSLDMKVLTDSLSRHGHQVLPAVREDTMIVEVVFQGHNRSVADLSAALVTEIDERQRVLSAHEREVLETHLVNEVAGALQELVAGAEQQVATMNDELQDRPTSTGMRLRLLWRPTRDAPPGLTELRARQLRQSTDVWNDADRRAIGDFLQEQISRERLRDEAATWHEQLTRALDYRAWHEFAIQRHQDGQWRPATGPASGGERVLAASIPLFAAASSYYGSAGNPYAPRLIALDEAFAGVDDDSRAKCLGLLATFDLDVVMTSEREWGCYPQVPGLGIAQLARHDGIDAVLVTPWRWDGRERHRMRRVELSVPQQRPTRPDGEPDPAGPDRAGPDGAAQPGLWSAE